jgi:hypothetical protein
MKNTCSHCKYAVSTMHEKQLVLICKRHPPVMHVVPAQDTFGRVGMNIMTLHPQVTNDNFCGDFSEKEVTVKLIS